MEAHETSKGGRPRGFDRAEALEAAMRLFWRHGYEGVSVGDLTKALGIAAPSLYAAFGNKADLYRAALKRYEEMANPLDLSGFDDAAPLDQAVRKMLTLSVQAVTGRGRERGCMISDGMVACGSEHGALARDLAARRRKFRSLLQRKLQARMDRPAAQSMALYLAAVMQGISIQARDGASAAELGRIVDQVTAGLK